ncbi:MAG: hypothetical protein Q9M48_02920 [Rhodobacterales bacterium]|nr:hypothetical protein [Rhodobacterales bacterium]
MRRFALIILGIAGFTGQSGVAQEWPSLKYAEFRVALEGAISTLEADSILYD